MNTSALIMMLVTEITIICITIYFFVKVLKTPPKNETDSYTENDEDQRE